MATIDVNGEMKRQQKVLVTDKLMLTSDEAKELLGIGKNTLIALTQAGYICYLELGSKRCYPRWALEEFTRNFMFKRIDLQSLEVAEIENDYDELVQRLKQDNQVLKNKLDMAKKALA
ncbi:helix-turn-helix domain-containing protein [Turicibacter sanguinis]|nr:helix-turn-helix domain-containing protein [Turicibacter sanguinis]MTN52203.1 helix-turn-helix domain-containing protein [Turicibacter sanguinis]MTN55257.1 helix-turn-helix domain-containing protein [Turicibacter sanguinis]MTN58479.1 helix-turn-helix domain-containing protein [Turicibacter sanguinis]MTN61576.1 helix-turn-helix domain-containing protein [Turicibacter sanguinis]